MRFRLELGFLGEALLGIGLDFGDLGREIAWRERKEEVVIVDMEAISVLTGYRSCLSLCLQFSFLWAEFRPFTCTSGKNRSSTLELCPNSP